MNLMGIPKHEKPRQKETVWFCPLCGNKEHTTDPYIVRMHCPGCHKCSWMVHNGKKDNGE